MYTRKRVGDYFLLNLLGEGQFGKVYRGVRADNPAFFCAIKCVPRQLVDHNAHLYRLFLTELEVMRKVRSPHLITISELVQSSNNYYLVMPFCEGGDLQELLQVQGRFSEAQAIDFLRQIVAGFRELRMLKVIHRDLKLANIFLRRGIIVIGDFGLARLGQEMTCTVLGTPVTMAPEMVLQGGKASYDSKTDIWSIGIAFCQMLFGTECFNPQSLEELRQRLKHFNPVLFSGAQKVPLARSTWDLVFRLLQVSAQKRICWEELFNHSALQSSLRQMSMREPKPVALRLRYHSMEPGNCAIASPQRPTFSKIFANFIHENKKSNFTIFAALQLQKALLIEGIGQELREEIHFAVVTLSLLALRESESMLAKLEKARRETELDADYFALYMLSSNKKLKSWLIKDIRSYQCFYAEGIEKAARSIHGIATRQRLQWLMLHEHEPSVVLRRLLLEPERIFRYSLLADSSSVDKQVLNWLYLRICACPNAFLVPNTAGSFDWDSFSAGLTPVLARGLLHQLRN